ncbi:MAG: helix-turn-helix transcriptional regulator [Clostridiales bacterium]|nr:helix-turn-helix transcriptional regulator [Clostridiales bacterium]
MGKEARKVFDYYQDECWVFRLGYVHYKEASSPLSTHTHSSMMEFVILEKGSQKYQVEGREYVIRPGEIFRTYPYEQHDTGTSPEEKASLYYLIVDVEKVLENYGGCEPEDREKLRAYFEKSEEKIQKCDSGVLEVLGRFIKIMEEEQKFRKTKIRNILSETLMSIAEAPEKERRQKNSLMERSRIYIQEHICEEISLETLAELEEMSLSTFKSYFRNITGIPPAEYILRKKIEQAKRQLMESKASITEIAFSCGFSSSQYFATVFKRFCYVSPSQFRERHSKECAEADWEDETE